MIEKKENTQDLTKEKNTKIDPGLILDIRNPKNLKNQIKIVENLPKNQRNTITKNKNNIKIKVYKIKINSKINKYNNRNNKKKMNFLKTNKIMRIWQ